MSKTEKVIPRLAKGFPEWSPAEKLVEDRFLKVIKKHYELAGFTPIETPSIELTEIVSAKGGAEKEIYSIARLNSDNGDDDNKKMSLHFDLTVPLARYITMREREIVFPFRRSQIQKVWRGEKPQTGRFREFYQCDIDVIGQESLSYLNDAQIPSIINDIFTELNIGKFLIRINNRKVLQGYLSFLGIQENYLADCLRIIDKIDKIGAEKMRESLEKGLGISQENSQKIIDFISIKVDNKNIKESMKSVECDNSIYLQGLDELCIVGAGLIAFDVPAENYVIDLSIARGLDYYTGTVYETILVDKKEVGSICSGGRYEDLASHFSDKKFVGVGISIGLSRLLSKLFEMNVLDIAQQTTSKIMIATFPDIDISNYFKIAKNIMQSDMACEVYTEGGKLGNQIKYADRKGIKYVIISGQEEMDKNIITVKDLKNSETFNVEKDKLISFLKEIL